MTFMQPDTVAIVFAVTPHSVVGEVTLSYLKVGVYYDLRKRKRIRLILENLVA